MIRFAGVRVYQSPGNGHVCAFATLELADASQHGGTAGDLVPEMVPGRGTGEGGPTHHHHGTQTKLEGATGEPRDTHPLKWRLKCLNSGAWVSCSGHDGR
jgi:hypothetical protein